jgi:hypothetical protein
MALRKPQPDGFLMPLSVAASLVLLLSGLSVQTAALQARARLEADLRRAQADDALASAAQQLADQLSGPFACLLPLPSVQWAQQVCAEGRSGAALLAGTVAGHAYQVVAWTPAATTTATTTAEPAQLLLQLVVERGGRGVQRRFAVSLAEQPGLAPIRAVRGLGL